MLKKIVLVFALMAGAFALSPSAGRAAPLAPAIELATQAPLKVEKARWYRVRYYRRHYYRPRRYYVRRYYYPRRHYYRRHYYRRW